MLPCSVSKQILHVNLVGLFVHLFVLIVNTFAFLCTDLTGKLKSTMFFWPLYLGFGLLTFPGEMMNCNYQGIQNGSGCI